MAIQPAKTREFLRLYLDLLRESVREADRAGAEGMVEEAKDLAGRFKQISPSNDVTVRSCGGS